MFRAGRMVIFVTLLALLFGLSATPTFAATQTIRFWGHSNSAFTAANETLIKDFEKQNPGIKVVYETFPYDNFVPKLQTAFGSRTEADVVEMFGMWVEPYAKAGQLAPVPASVMSKTQLERTYFDAPLRGFAYKGKYYGLPREFNLENGGMIINKALFDQAGIKPEFTNWDEVIAAARKLTKTEGGRITQAGFHFLQGDPVNFFFYSLILQQGGKLFDKDGVHVKLTTPEGYRAMQFMVDFVQKHKVTSVELPMASPAFYQGISAMYHRGPWIIGVVKQDYPQLKWDYVTLPSFTKNPPYFTAESGWGLVVSQRCKNKDAAWKFVKFMASKAPSRQWNIKTFTLPAYKELATDPAFLKAMPELKPSLGILQYGRFIGPLQNRDRFFDIVFNRFMEAASGRLACEAAVQAMEKDLNAMIDEYVKH